MSEMSPEIVRPYGISIQAVEHVYRSEPGQILYQYIDDWVRLGIEPRLMLMGVEAEHGVRLSQVAEKTLGAWATERTIQHNTQQAFGQGEIEWQ
jgi:hypothetical protein